MRAVVFHAIGDIRLEEVPDPKIIEPTDAIVRLTASAICGTDLHFVRGTVGPMKPGTILGHEGVGIVEEVGKAVRNLKVGDRVVVPSTIACGVCFHCRSGYFAQCLKSNPNGPDAGTAFYGGPQASGPFNGLQAERARIPFASINLVRLPDEITDDQAISLSDIFPTGYFGADIAGIRPGQTVAIFGCGPVGQFAIASAIHMRAGLVLAVDSIESRLESARCQGAETINFEKESPVEAIKKITDGLGVDIAIDAVGIDANHPHRGPAYKQFKQNRKEIEEEEKKIAPETNPKGDNWHPGDAPSQALEWGVKALRKTGTFSIIGVYSEKAKVFPIGEAMNKNLTLKMGNCNHRKYIPELIDFVRAGRIDPSKILSNVEPLTSVIEAYQAFDTRKPGWLKVKLEPSPGIQGIEAA